MSVVERMRAVLAESDRGGVPSVSAPVTGEPFLILNPDYHDGKRASFMYLPDAFYRTTLLGRTGVSASDVLAAASARVLTVTERGVVLTLMTKDKIVHAVMEVVEAGGAPGFAKLFDAATAEGWVVASADHQAFFDELARVHGMGVGQLLQLPAGAVRAKGGDA